MTCNVVRREHRNAQMESAALGEAPSQSYRKPLKNNNYTGTVTQSTAIVV